MANKIIDQLVLAVFAVMICLILLTFADYGVSWDEPIQAQYGNLVLSFFATGFDDRAVLTFQNLQSYGGLFDALVELVAKASPWAPHETRHLVTALTGLLGIAGAWRFARYSAGPVAGLVTTLFLISVPSYYGHLYINPKDIPFAAGYIWTLYFIVKAFEEFPKIATRDSLILGGVLGTTLAIRVGGVLLIGYIGLLAAFLLVWQRTGSATGPARTTPILGTVRTLAPAAFRVFVPAYILMIAAWPSALVNPVFGPLLSVWRSMRFHWDHTTLLAGEYVRAMDLPAYYVPVYLGVKLPEFLLVAALILLPLAALGTGRALRNRDQKAICRYGILWLGIFFPLVSAVVLRSVHYDAIRHFLFVIPPLTVLLGIEAARAVEWLLPRRPRVVAGAAIFLAAELIHTAWVGVTLHPYQYIYYNVLAGQVQGAAGRFELDYWATSYKEAIGKLAAFVDQEDKMRNDSMVDRTYTVGVCGPAGAASPFLPQGFRPAVKIEDVDFMVAFTRWSCDDKYLAPTVAEVRRRGVRLSVVKDLRRGFRLDPRFSD
jgi:hypothetical protein